MFVKFNSHAAAVVLYFLKSFFLYYKILIHIYIEKTFIETIQIKRKNKKNRSWKCSHLTKLLIEIIDLERFQFSFHFLLVIFQRQQSWCEMFQRHEKQKVGSQECLSADLSAQTTDAAFSLSVFVFVSVLCRFGIMHQFLYHFITNTYLQIRSLNISYWISFDR